MLAMSNPKMRKIWQEHDQQQAGTLYWTHVTDPQNDPLGKLAGLLAQQPIDYPGKEFIMHPGDAARLVQVLEELGVAVMGVSVWCFIPAGKSKDEHCCDGMGGPSRKVGDDFEWFNEYVHLGFMVPDFDTIPRDTDLAHQCNPQVRDYIERQLPDEPGFNEYFRVSLMLYVPLMWELFPEHQ